MTDLTLDVARKILDAALAKGVEKKLKPLVITILDALCERGIENLAGDIEGEFSHERIPL